MTKGVRSIESFRVEAVGHCLDSGSNHPRRVCVLECPIAEQSVVLVDKSTSRPSGRRMWVDFSNASYGAQCGGARR
jgi:hypothetical protein